MPHRGSEDGEGMIIEPLVMMVAERKMKARIERKTVSWSAPLCELASFLGKGGKVGRLLPAFAMLASAAWLASSRQVSSVVLALYAYRLSKLWLAEGEGRRRLKSAMGTLEPAFYFAAYPLTVFLGVPYYVAVAVMAALVYVEMELPPFNTASSRDIAGGWRPAGGAPLAIALYSEYLFRFGLAAFLATLLGLPLPNLWAVVIYLVMAFLGTDTPSFRHTDALRLYRPLRTLTTLEALAAFIFRTLRT